MITALLLRLAELPLPTPPDDTIRRKNAASLLFRRRAFHLISLLTMWAFACVGFAILMAVLAAIGDVWGDRGRYTGIGIGAGFCGFAIIGLFINSIRYIIAQQTVNNIELDYKKIHGKTSSEALFEGYSVEPANAPFIEMLTRPRDIDLLCQVVIGAVLGLLTFQLIYI